MQSGIELLKQTENGPSGVQVLENTFAYPFEVSEQARPWIQQINGIEQKYGIPKNLFARLIQRESNFNPKAVNPKSGASGIAQIMPKLHPTVDPFDANAALDYGGSLLAKNYKQFGDWQKAVGAYNAGPGVVAEHGAAGHTQETKDYVSAVAPSPPGNLRVSGIDLLKQTAPTPMPTEKPQAMVPTRTAFSFGIPVRGLPEPDKGEFGAYEVRPPTLESMAEAKGKVLTEMKSSLDEMIADFEKIAKPDGTNTAAVESYNAKANAILAAQNHFNKALDEYNSLRYSVGDKGYTGGYITQGDFKHNFVTRALETVTGMFGIDFDPHQITDQAKANATVQVMAKRAGLPLHEYRYSPTFIEQAASSFVSSFMPGLMQTYEAATGEAPWPATSEWGRIGGKLGSLAGFLAGPIQAIKTLPFMASLPTATQAMPLGKRILIDSIGNSVTLALASTFGQFGEAAKQLTVGQAADALWEGFKGGALTGTVFGFSRGLFPADGVQTGARLITGLLGMNLQRIAEAGENPYKDRTIADFIFDVGLDAFFLYHGLPEGKVVKLTDDIQKTVEKSIELTGKEDLIKNIPDIKVQEAQLKVLQDEKARNELEKQRIAEKAAKELEEKKTVKENAEKVKKAKEAKPKVERTPEQIAADKEKMAALRAKKKPKAVAPEVTPEVPSPEVPVTPPEKKKVGRPKKEPVPEVVLPTTEEELAGGIIVTPDQIAEIEKAKGDIDELSNVDIENFFKEKGWEIKKEKPTAPPVGKTVLADDEKLQTIEDAFPNGATDVEIEKFMQDKGMLEQGETPVQKEAVVEVPIEAKSEEPDTVTGTKEPEELDTDISFFRVSPEATARNTQVYSKRSNEIAKNINDARSGSRDPINTKDIGLTMRSLINDVNRWLDGDTTVDIEHTRNFMSEVIAESDQPWVRDQFRTTSGAYEDTEWVNEMKSAADWARKADRPKIDRTRQIFPDGTMHLFVDPFKIPEVVKFMTQWFKENLGREPIEGKALPAEDAYRLFKATGYFFDPYDRRWKFEIDDSQVRFKIGIRQLPSTLYELDTATQKTVPTIRFKLGQIIDYQQLFTAYPEAKEIGVVRYSMTGKEGEFNSTLNSIDISNTAFDPNSTLFHEIQHWIQWKEDFAYGGNTRNAIAVASRENTTKLSDIAYQQLLSIVERSNIGIVNFDRMIKNLQSIPIQDHAEVRFLAKEFDKLHDQIDQHFIPGYYETPEGREALAGQHAAVQRMMDVTGLSKDDSLELLNNLQYADDYSPYSLINKFTENRTRAIADFTAKSVQLARLKERRALVEANPQDIDALHDLKSTLIDVAQLSHEAYIRLAGEIEARNVQNRLAFRAEARSELPPWTTAEAFGPGEVIVHFSGEPNVSMPGSEPAPSPEDVKKFTEEMLKVEDAEAIIQTRRGEVPTVREQAEAEAKQALIDKSVYGPLLERPKPEVTEGRKIKTIETEFRLSKVNLLPSLLKDIGNQQWARTWIYEAAQNSLDAEAKNLTIMMDNTDPSHPYPDKGPVVTFTDDGWGMTPEQVDKFMLVGGSIGKTGTTTRGGYGNAKIALFLIPERFHLESVKDGVKSTIDANRDDIMEGKINIEVTETKEPNGTTLKGWMPDQLMDVRTGTTDFQYAIDEIARGTWVDSKIEAFTRSISGDIPYINKAPALLRNAPHKAPSETFTLNGSRVSVHFIEVPKYGYADYETRSKFDVGGMVTNKGLIVDIHAGNTFLDKIVFPERPDFKVIVDFEETPPVRDTRYPFLKNRTQLVDKFVEKIKEIAKKKVEELRRDVTQGKSKKFVEMLAKSPEYDGVRVMIPYEGEQFDRAKAIIEQYLPTIKKISGITAKFTKMLIESGEKEVNFHLTIDPEVFGYKTNKFAVGEEIYAINPFNLDKKYAESSELKAVVATGAKLERLQADNATHTLVHEYVHKYIFNHSEDYTMKFGTVTTTLGHENLAELSRLFRSYYESEGSNIAAIAKDLSSLRKSGTGLKALSENLSTSHLDSARAEGLPDMERRLVENRRRQAALYSGVPVDEAVRGTIQLGRDLFDYIREAEGKKKFKLDEAIDLMRTQGVRSFIERSGNLRRKFLEYANDPEKGIDLVEAMYLQKGAHPKATRMLEQMRAEVSGGLTRQEQKIRDGLILAKRLLDIASYKTAKQFAFPNKATPDRARIASELFMYGSVNGYGDLTPDRAGKVERAAEAYAEWMKKAVNDAFEEGLITEQERNDLVSHNYRRIRLVETIFDKKNEVTIGGKKITVYDSGIEHLARGRKTDIYEPNSEVLALETFNRLYSRIYKNRAGKEMLDLARADKENPFVRVKESKEDKIPHEFRVNRSFVYENGERKTLFLSPDVAEEWLTSNAQTTYKYAQMMKYVSGSPLLRMFATGINWAFALRNLPRDVQTLWFAARTFKDGKWTSVYSPHMPIAAYQIGQDISGVFRDAVLRKGRWDDYINDGGGMDLLTVQGRMLVKGKHLEGPVDKFFDTMGYLGSTSEIMTRLAIRERVLRSRAAERGITIGEAAKDKKISREATFAARDYLDFSQGGDLTKAADNAFPYLNARIQAMRGIVRSFKPGSGTAAVSCYKLAQFAAFTTAMYIGNQLLHPKTMKALKDDKRTSGNLVFPLGDMFGFQDSRGQTRYPFIVIPIDQAMMFFKTLFEGGADLMMGKEVDVDRITQTLSQFAPLQTTSLPPTVSAALGYTVNKDFWLGKDIWTSTDKPFGYARSKEEYIPGKTPQAMIDIGQVTGLSPERLKYALGQLITSDNMYAQLLGVGYERAFGQLPQVKREQALAETISQLPLVRAFFKVTSPGGMGVKETMDAEEKAAIDKWIEDRGLDVRVEGYLFDKNFARKDVMKYIMSFKDPDTQDRLLKDFEFQQDTKSLPNRTFWLKMHRLVPEARAAVYVNFYDKATPQEKAQLSSEAARADALAGIFTSKFLDEVMMIRAARQRQK